jgi:hypothetical protein
MGSAVQVASSCTVYREFKDAQFVVIYCPNVKFAFQRTLHSVQ